MANPFEPLADFKPADLPEKKRSFWKLAGPGVVLVGLSISAGEYSMQRDDGCGVAGLHWICDLLHRVGDRWHPLNYRT